MNKEAILEGLLFVVGDEGLSLKKICEIMSIDLEEAKQILMKLKDTYESDSRGIRISFLGETFKLTSKKEHKEYYQKLLSDSNTEFLTNAALETLAYIAYNEPVTRIDIDNARGISSAHLVRKLLARDLIKVAGKSEAPGHPNLYKTTSEFLDYFGLSSLSDLPELPKINEDNDKELFSSIYKENV